MKKTLVSMLVLLSVLAGAQEISRQIEQMLWQAPYMDQEILVRVRDEAPATRDLFRGVDVASMREVSSGLYKIQVSGDMKLALSALWENTDILYAEPNYILHIFQTPNDPKFRDLWGMGKIDAEKAWDVRTDGSPVVVAVIDTGVDYNHPDLQANMWVNEAEKNGKAGVDDDGNGYVDDIHGWNGAEDNGDPMDGHDHGTHCSGTIAGRGNNGIGVAGVCWTARLMACKFLKANGSGTSEDAIECIDYAVKNGAKVLSNSWGGGGFSLALYESIQRAAAKGVLFVAAAGNDSSDELSFPAKYCESNTDSNKTYPALGNVLAVGASTSTDDRASFSQFSKASNSGKAFVVAPGENILSCVRNNGYSTMSGTSMATPHVAGVATLVWAQHPSLTYQALISRLFENGNTVTWTHGWWDQAQVRRINLNNSIR